MNRDDMISAMAETETIWDVVVIGGGATGLGAALEAVSRGHRTALVEARDFASGTSSRSTKLIHGGVRYLRQGRIGMVRQSLQERGRLLRNAPHLVHPIHFVLPVSSRTEQWYYFAGLRLYDALGGRSGFSPARRLSAATAFEYLPGLNRDRCEYALEFSDGQFDDARLAITLAQTAVDHGAVLANYLPVISLIREHSRIRGVVVRDEETGRELQLKARVVINATGVFSADIQQLDAQYSSSSAGSAKNTENIQVSPSQGSHLVFNESFLPGHHALMIPHTDDGRVLFAIPWHGRVLFGTTDLPVDNISAQPRPLQQEVDYLLEHAGRYLSRRPEYSDILAMYAGLRPLVRAAGSNRSSASLSREHEILTSSSGLLSVIGGKWTTYRHMGEQLVNTAEDIGRLRKRPSRTADLRLRGAPPLRRQNSGDGSPESLSATSVYGTDYETIQSLVQLDATRGDRLHPELPYTVAEVIWAAEQEMARTPEDILARRTRALLLDTSAAVASAETVTAILAKVLRRDQAWCDARLRQFNEIRQQYAPLPAGRTYSPFSHPK